jgi:hypothetical protein
MGISKDHCGTDPLNQVRKRSRCREKFDSHDDLSRTVPRKRVRFARPSTSLEGNILAEEVHESKLCHSDLDKKNLWWSKDERRKITSESRKTARSFRKKNRDQVSHYLFVFEKCSQPPSHASSDFLEKATLSVPTLVRGLECGFVPSIKACRRKHAQEILDTQEQLQTSRLPIEISCRVLSTRSMHSSRPSRVMARLIGDGDMVA